MDNTVGSPNTSFCNFPKSTQDYYILGLWCADGYHWTSSIGLSNIDLILIKKFRNFLSGLFPKERIKLDQYRTGKRKYVGYKIYVNCRPLLRIFKKFKDNNNERSINNAEAIKAYIAGRFDGDGCISKDLKRDCRISYGNEIDAKLDTNLLQEIGIMPKLYRYRTSNTFVIYISRFDTKKFTNVISPYSIKLQKLVLGSRRDSDYTEIVRMATNNI
ncbi:MAG: hypothetical protein A2736_02350 [Candidatus Yanofskybacteria bacterium RIFCSPHIGHO2_01_FULL_41_27]|uniref:DOD-type homing endonuclease domain-containing protein n=2 Tax=Candidatus Yanofskyibacteriota TaxID=1752733 RepID=A0A1F8HVH8_9BACT|nr:MAG: hypothetical protein A2736_02350 [Candidatus Yanofskybacteria bacterium RIFCSPHIGHO2_01_FULL_41_27]OGN10089.1 MAG: hypothetical protein A3C64_02715 [Candidatus Yanofskybacteria bacterium RIFCSPHIGHO2_02_FULL_41_12]OGN20768.1 MAG: hypothetical protein A3B00_02840 [Candidatus Yanofskybacteria bacterium RIFCSPLOWO2_01_FULL_41_33]OGN41574.1 MAG: hypothetical protein A2606_00090 [Candidatus Yanofskybacteria bacterium RIFOXYD1_FULL_42_10]